MQVSLKFFADQPGIVSYVYRQIREGQPEPAGAFVPTLSEIATIFARAEPVSAGYAYQLSKSAEYFERDAGKIDISAISESHIDAHLRAMFAAGASTDYASLRRRCLLRLIDWAQDHGYRNTRLDRRVIKRTNGRKRLVDGFTRDEASQLLRTAIMLAGVHRDGVLRSLYWESAIRVMWDTGISGCDLRSLPLSKLGLEAVTHSFQIQRSKTGAPFLARLHQSTQQSVAAFLAHVLTVRKLKPDSRPWGLWGQYVSDWRREARELIRAAGLTGSMKYLRSGSGSEVEADNPGMGCRHLANTQAVFDQSYRVPRIVDRNKPLPPELGR